MLHSAGHLLDICMRNVGLGHLEPGKGYHFSDGPFVEYKGIVPQDQLQTKQKELELEANALIFRGGKVSASVLPYEEAVKWCCGDLPSYISKVTQIRTKKGLTKVFYNIDLLTVLLSNDTGCICRCLKLIGEALILCSTDMINLKMLKVLEK